MLSNSLMAELNFSRNSEIVANFANAPVAAFRWERTRRRFYVGATSSLDLFGNLASKVALCFSKSSELSMILCV